MDEQDLLELSAFWRNMAVQFTEATKRTDFYRGQIVQDDGVERITKLLGTAMSDRGIRGVNRLGRCLRRPDDDHLHWALASLDELDAKLRAEVLVPNEYPRDNRIAFLAAVVEDANRRTKGV